MCFSIDPVHLLEVAAQVSALREGHLAVAASEGSNLGVLAEVVSKVAALLEHFIAPFKPACEIELLSICSFATNFDSLIPGPRNTPKRLWQEVKQLTGALTRIRDDTHLLKSYLRPFIAQAGSLFAFSDLVYRLFNNPDLFYLVLY